MRRLSFRPWVNPESEHADSADPHGSVIAADQRDSVPPRPSIPLVLPIAFGMWASAALVLEASRFWEPSSCLMIALASCLVALAVIVFSWRFRVGAVAVCLVTGLALGTGAASAHAASLHDASANLAPARGPWVVELLEDASEGSFGASALVRAYPIEGGDSVRVVARFHRDGGVPRYGDAFIVEGSVGQPRSSSAARLWREGAMGELRLSSCEPLQRDGALGALVCLRSRAIDLLNGSPIDDKGLTAALVCGWRGGVDEDTYRAFQVTGLAHLVAVSGSHLSIVAAFAGGVLQLMRAPRPVAILVQAVLLLCYLVLTAVPLSAVRSAVMAFAGLASFYVGRRPAALSALSACVGASIALSPDISLSATFALSALATFGIVVFGGLAKAWIRSLAPRVPAFAREAVALTLASALFATPLSVSLFSQLSFAAPLANVVTAPLFAPVCSVGLVCALAAVAVPPAAGALSTLACVGCAVLACLVDVLACVPFAAIPASAPLIASIAVSFCAVVALWLFWPGPPRKANRARAAAFACALLALAVFTWPRQAATELVMLDVGQGDAILVRSGSRAILVDTGNQDTKLREALARHGVAKLDAVLVTHGDDDHMGSLASMAGTVSVGSVLVAEDALSCSCSSCDRLRLSAEGLVGRERVHGLGLGDRFQVGQFDVGVVWPRGFSDDGGNADSISIVIDADVDGDGTRDWRSLLVGDAEEDELAEMIGSGSVQGTDVYKVGHHGSKKALGDESAARLSPALSLVSCGAGNRYGHPSAETIARLEQVGSRIERTDLSGDIRCVFEADAIRVTTQR